MLRIDDTHPMSDYMDLLNTSTTIYIDPIKLDNAVLDSMYSERDYRNLAEMAVQIDTAGTIRTVGATDLYNYLDLIGMSKATATRKNKSGHSLDMKKVIQPLIDRGIATDVLVPYKMMSSYRSYNNFLTKLQSRSEDTISLGNGRFATKFSTNITERENLRVYYSDIAVVSIPKKYSDIITTSGINKHLAWVDYPQADWRFAYNLFIRNDDNFDIMAKCDDAYEGLARICLGDNFDPERFLEQRKEFKVNCLKVFYNSSDNADIPKLMRQYYMSCPKYARYVNDLAALYNFKIPIKCTSYFGHEQILPAGAYPAAFISKGLNTPIQTFTSHVVNETVFGILEKFWSMGYTKDDINVYFVRHDEPIFMFSDNIIKDSWVFKDCSEIRIDGFTPIHLDFFFGDYYGEEDQALTDRINTYAKDGESKITDYDVGTIKEYYPIPRTERLTYELFSSLKDEAKDKPDSELTADDITYKVNVYDANSNKEWYIDTGVGDEELAIKIVTKKMTSVLDYPRYMLVDTGTVDCVEQYEREEGSEDKTLVVLRSTISCEQLRGYFGKSRE